MSLTAGNLFISSYNNQDNDSSTSFGITLAVPVTRAKGLRFVSATIPHLMMPFGANDKTWVFKVNGTDYTMTFPTTTRWATIGDFVTFCNTATTGLFATASPSACPVSISYTTGTNQLTLTTTTPGQVIIMPGWSWNNTFGTSVAYNANFRLGFTSGGPVSGTTTLTADGYPNIFLRTNNIYITTNISTDSNNDANVANIIGKIPVNIDYGGLIVYDNFNAEFQPAFAPNFKDIRFRLLDEDYQVLVNPANAYFNIVLSVVY
jgi:hypothetical protein